MNKLNIVKPNNNIFETKQKMFQFSLFRKNKLNFIVFRALACVIGAPNSWESLKEERKVEQISNVSLIQKNKKIKICTYSSINQISFIHPNYQSIQ